MSRTSRIETTCRGRIFSFFIVHKNSPIDWICIYANYSLKHMSSIHRFSHCLLASHHMIAGVSCDQLVDELFMSPFAGCFDSPMQVKDQKQPSSVEERFKVERLVKVWF